MYRRYSKLNSDEIDALYRSNMATARTDSSGRPPMLLYLVRLSPPCRVVWLYLLQQDIPHEIVDSDFSKAEKAPEFFNRFPHKEVPVLVDGDITVFDAPAILHYLSQHVTSGIGFGYTIQTKCLVDSLISWANSELHRVVGYAYSYPQFFEKYTLKNEEANSCFIEHGIKLLSKQLERIEEGYLNGESKKYLAGERITIADSFVATVLLQVEWTGFKFNLWPRVNAWLRRVRAQEFWAEVHTDHNKVVSELESAVFD